MKKKSIQDHNNGVKQKRKLYPPENMKKAVAAVKEGSSFRQAGKMFGVPWQTLYRKLKLPNSEDSTSGPPTVLKNQQEDDLVSWMEYRDERGYPVTKYELINAVHTIVTDLEIKNPFRDSIPGRHWYENFIRRHPNVPIGPTRSQALQQSTTDKDLQEWFCKIRIFLRNRKLLNIEPSRIFACDEMSINLCPDTKEPITDDEEGNNEETVKTLFMYSADGTQAPPLVMYKYKDFVPKKIINCPSDWGIGLSKTGTIVTESFFKYITRVFYLWLLKQDVKFPIIVYLGKHAAHVSPSLSIFCKKNKIELLALPLNFTHLVQPLNIALFRPFEDAWSNNLSQWKMENNETRLNRDEFPRILRMTLDSLEEKSIIIEGFRMAGLVPFDPHVIDYSSLKKKIYKTAKFLESVKSETLISSELFQDKLHLQIFESNISKELLDDFIKCEVHEVWTGDVENQGIFEYWLQIKKAADETEMMTINNSVILEKDKIQEGIACDVPIKQSDN